MTTQERLDRIVFNWRRANAKSLQTLMNDRQTWRDKLRDYPLDEGETQDDRDYEMFSMLMATDAAALAAMLQAGEIEIRCTTANYAN